MSLAVAVALLLLIAGCHGGSSSSPTAPSTGTSVLSGQVLTTGDLAGSSAGGINVSCSGQIAVTDATGRFSFVGLSSIGMVSAMSNGRTLNFTRGDGIDAQGSVSTAATAVTVQLQKHSATITEGQSGDDKGGGQGETQELEGPITAISDSSITVHNASTASDVKAAITKSTVIRKGNTPLTAKDLHKGDQVHVKTTGSGDNLTATEIMLQNPAS